MKRTLITGANRGLGLAFTRESLAGGYRVFATCRRPGEADDLEALAAEHPEQLSVLQLDVTDDESIEASARAAGSEVEALDLLINNAGISPDGERLGKLDRETMLDTFDINAVGPMMVAQHHLGLLRGSEDPMILNISSALGSLSRKSSGGRYSCCSSKAALNMLTRALAFDLQSEGISVVAIHPGWVRTDMGGRAAPLAPAESVRQVLEVADGLTLDDTGAFYSYEGRQLPW